MKQKLETAAGGSNKENARVVRPKAIGNLQQAMLLDDDPRKYSEFRVKSFSFSWCVYKFNHIYYRKALEAMQWSRVSNLTSLGLNRTPIRLHLRAIW